jgi:hypothetical protein
MFHFSLQLLLDILLTSANASRVTLEIRAEEHVVAQVVSVIAARLNQSANVSTNFSHSRFPLAYQELLSQRTPTRCHRIVFSLYVSFARSSVTIDRSTNAMVETLLEQLTAVRSQKNSSF